MNEIQRLYYINLAISSDSADEQLAEVLSFYGDFLGMVSMEIPVNDLSGSYEDQQRSLEAFGGLYDLAGKNMDVAVHFLRGAEASPQTTCIDLQRYQHPQQRSVPAETPYEIGIRNMTLLVDDLDLLYQRGNALGISFIHEPVAMNLPDLGEVRFAVAFDPAGNRVELLQTGEAAEDCDGKVVRIFSININCENVEKSLAFYRDVLGMKLEMDIDFSDLPAWGAAMGAGDDVQAHSYYLRGHQDEAATYLSLTGWINPLAVQPTRPGGCGNNWFRMCLWASSDDITGPLYQRSKSVVDFMAPPSEDNSPVFGESCLAAFYDLDGVIQELAFSGSWQGF